MENYLKTHAVKNVWCSPDQDSQYIFKPARLSKPNGNVRIIQVEWDSVVLPDATNVWHVFQIGGVSTSVIDLLPNGDVWVRADELMATNRRVIDAYTEIGIELSKSDVYFKKHRNRNLIVSIRENTAITSIRNKDVYIRLYKNAFFGSSRSHPEEDLIHVNTVKVTETVDAVIFNNEVATRRALKGHVYMFSNGYYIETLNPTTVQVGDVLELVHDTAIREVLQFNVSDLETFSSELDGITKYLLVRYDYVNDIIDYQDDIDIFIVGNFDGVEKGLFYNKSNDNSLRMVTHKDYSIPVSALTSLVNAVPGLTNVTELKLVLHIRESGYDRPLVFEHNRIHELIKLDKASKLDAMVGAQANILEWTASKLEVSNYSKIMRSEVTEITQPLVEDAYGYNAVASLLAKCPNKVGYIEGVKAVDLTLGLFTDATMFEYDVQGRLVNWYHHDSGGRYYPKNEITGYVEGVMGLSTYGHGIKFGFDFIDTLNNVGWKAYITDIVGGNQQEHLWRDAVLNVDYTLDNGRLTWSVDPALIYTALKYDKEFLAKSDLIDIVEGVLELTIESADDHKGITLTRPIGIQPAKLDLFLNNHPLIEGLDYNVKWPHVVICNKEYLLDAVEQRVTYRTSGFCTSDMVRLPPNEYGFVTHGLLSVNNRFDIRDDKVIRCVVDGRLETIADLLVSEDDSGLRMDNVRNGAPYIIDEVFVPLASHITVDIHDFRSRSLVLDKKISDYMTLHSPEPVQPPLSIIERKHQLFSPFLSRIHSLLSGGYLYPDGIEGQYSETDIAAWLTDYVWLLDFDPLIIAPNKDYVFIQPTELFFESKLTIWQFNFLQRVANLYFANKIDFTNYVSIKDNWI